MTKFKIEDVKIIAYFIKSRSWIKEKLHDESKRNQLLNHEQGHFDGAKEITQKMEIKVNNEIKNKSFSCKGKTLDEQKIYAQRKTKKIIGNIIEKGINELTNFHEKYDKDTNHGSITKMQIEYDNRFKKLRE